LRIDSNGEAAAGGSLDFIDFAMVVIGGGQAGDRLSLIDNDDTTNDGFSVTSKSIGVGGSLFGSDDGLDYDGFDSLTLEAANANVDATVSLDDLFTPITLNFTNRRRTR